MRFVSTLSTLGFAGLLLASCTINGNPFDFTGNGSDGTLIECVTANATAGELAGLTEREALDRAIELCLDEGGVPPADCYEEAYLACLAQTDGGDGDAEGEVGPDGTTYCDEVARAACDEPGPDPDCFEANFGACLDEGGDAEQCAVFADEVCSGGGGPSCEEQAWAECADLGIGEEECANYVDEVCGGGGGPSCEEQAFEGCLADGGSPDECEAYAQEVCGGGGGPSCEEQAFGVCEEEALSDEECASYVAETCGGGDDCLTEQFNACFADVQDEEFCSTYAIEACGGQPDGGGEAPVDPDAP